LSASLRWPRQKRKINPSRVRRPPPAYRILVWIILGLAAGCSNGAATLLEKADARLRQGDYLGAVQNYRTVVENYSKSKEAEEAYFSMGTVEVTYLQDYEGAILTFRSLIRDYPKGTHVPKAQQWIAEIYDQKLHKPRTAIAEYQKLAEMTKDPDFRDEVRFRIGEAYVELNDSDQARTEWGELLGDSPSGKWADRALYRIGTTLFLDGQYDQAENAYERLLKDYPESGLRAEAIAGTADCYEATGRLEEALAKYREAEADYPNPQVIQVKIKAIEEKLGDGSGK
jgi:TolA-binding protein